MADYKFLQNPVSGKYVILAPRRSKRTNTGKIPEPICPFCLGQEGSENELYRVGGEAGDSNWHIRVLANKFPFAPHHEIIIHSPDHHKNFDELPFTQVELILQTYRERYNAHKEQGQVYIFHNRGGAAGESLPHPHTQLVVIPREVELEIPVLDKTVIARTEGTKQSPKAFDFGKGLLRRSFAPRKDERNLDLLETEEYLVCCPPTSEWPDEVWIAPKNNGNGFGAITDQELSDLSYVLSRIIQLYDLRHGYEFPFNFYIYPGKFWYLRLMPRIKILGGFELGTQISVNTQEPEETFRFLREHFWQPDPAKIRGEQQADYWKSI